MSPTIGTQRDIVENEQVLARQLSAPQQAMMALGGAIGTGLFLASGLAVNVAGPAIILTYALVALIAILLGAAAAEMAVAHPTAGAFGVHAAMYLSPFAGYAVRVTYWITEGIATGGQLIAAAIYMAYWFPSVPGAVWVLLFGLAMIGINALVVGELGRVEALLVVIKLAAITLFLVVAVLMVTGLVGGEAVGFRNLTGRGGFMPFGVSGVWLASCFVIYSYIGVEIVAVTSGEAADPARTIPRAMRQMVLGLSSIYLITITLLLCVTAWTDLGASESPFVAVLRRIGIPYAAGVMNFVVLTAALSSVNANIYIMSRTMFSLARAGFIPRRLGDVATNRTPIASLLVSAAGLSVAVVVQALWPQSAYVWFFGVALFGGLFVWLMIFVTHIVFRGAAVPIGSYVGGLLIAGILISTWWVPALHSTLIAGVPWMLLLAVGYRFTVRGAEQPQ